MTDPNAPAHAAFIPGRKLHEHDEHHAGLTKREQFATDAMQGILANYPGTPQIGKIPAAIAVAAVTLADALIDALNGNAGALSDTPTA